ncbi:MAG: 23S rRNA (pseudouridine(1915)-N(3))-methyltransferase RlmH [Patescibacteria group bacterium]
MKIRVLAIAKKPQNWAAEAEQDFLYRLKNFTEVEITLLAPADENSLAEKAKKIEAEKLTAKISPADFVIACEPTGQNCSSEKFAEIFRDARDTAKKVVFVIGGSSGLGAKILERANLKIAFSKLTFPHELFRVILLEQIYRAFMILAGRKYHK